MSETDRVRLLIVDDDAACADAVGSLAEEAGYQVRIAHGGVAALELSERFLPDAVLSDVHMPDLEGTDVLRKLKRRDPALPVVLFTAYPDVPNAVAAMQAGAVDYVSKPANWDEIARTLRDALERRALLADNVALNTQLRERLGLGLRGLVGTSAAMQEIYRSTRRVAASRANVLITGESGTGKGELARTIHQLSERSDQPFLALHCASLSETLVESELFGHERGAFTGAQERRIGRFEQSTGGTLFIDEVAEIPMITQTKLLRVLQDRVFERVGGNEPIEVDVRLVAATNRDLASRVRAGRFREDLFYRLNVVGIEMPPLRERQGDVLLLANYFLTRSAAYNDKAVEGFDDSARERLLGYDWPGNVRELENAIERAVVMCRKRTLTADDLPDIVAHPTSVMIPGATMKEIELEAVRATFLATAGSTRRTAEVLGLSQRTVQYRLRELGLAKSRGRPGKNSKPT
jgi:two-component system response regulator HydG